MQKQAKQRNQQDASWRRNPHRQAVDRVEVIQAIHADHDQLGVANPHDVNDAEDQIEAERHECQHAPEQYAADDCLEQINVEEIKHCTPTLNAEIRLFDCVARQQ